MSVENFAIVSVVLVFTAITLAVFVRAFVITVFKYLVRGVFK